MKSLNITIFEIKKDEAEYMKKNLKGHKLQFFEEKIQDVDPKKFKNAEIVSVFIYSKVTGNILEQLPNLKAVTTRSTGFDHVDLEFCRKKNIPVGNVPFYGENTVAEHTFALLLNLSRKVHKSYLRTTQNNYSIDGLRGFDLKGKTLGIIGVGHIGLHVIRMAKGFGMHVKAFDINKDNFISEVLHFQYSDLDELLKTSDIISLHMPYNKHTHHFLNKAKMKKLKKGAIIINTARGGLIDTQALYDLLIDGHIGGCGLDVIEGEEIIMHEDELIKDSTTRKKMHELFTDKKILSMDNVIFTPHNAFNSQEALERILDSTIENIVEFNKNKTMKYPLKG